MQKSSIQLFHDIQEADSIHKLSSFTVTYLYFKTVFFPSQSVFCPVRFLDGQHALKRKDTVAVHIDYMLFWHLFQALHPDWIVCVLGETHIMKEAGGLSREGKQKGEQENLVPRPEVCLSCIKNKVLTWDKMLSPNLLTKLGQHLYTHHVLWCVSWDCLLFFLLLYNNPSFRWIQYVYWLLCEARRQMFVKSIGSQQFRFTWFI